VVPGRDLLGRDDGHQRSPRPTGQFGLAAQTGPLLAEFATLPALSLATTVLTGLLIVSVSRSVAGAHRDDREVWHGYRGRVGLVLVFSIGLGLAETLVLGALVGLVALVAASKAIGVAVVLGLVFAWPPSSVRSG